MVGMEMKILVWIGVGLTFVAFLWAVAKVWKWLQQQM